jgi:hypothetical protein
MHARSYLPAMVMTMLSLAALAAGDTAPWSVNVGVRMWNNEWDANSFPYSYSSNPYATGNTSPVLRQTVAHTRDTEIMTIPMVSARYGDWALTATSTLPRAFNLQEPGTSNRVVRHESDVSVAYYLTPQVSVGTGYKRIAWQNIRIAGPVVSLGLAAPLQHGMTFYGGAGLGHLRTHSLTEGTHFGVSYFIGEVGVSYALGNLSSKLDNLTALLAFRDQKVTAHGVPLNQTDGTGGGTQPYATTDVTDLTSGLVLGLTARF